MKVETLTECQKAKLPEYRDRWLAIGLDTSEVNKQEAIRGVQEAYKAAELEPPQVLFAASPLAIFLLYCQMANVEPTRENWSWLVYGYGQNDAHWLGVYEYFREVCGLKDETGKLTGLTRIAKSAGWFIPCERVCFVSDRPEVIHQDSDGRLHHEREQALKYRDGFGVYSWHGVRLPLGKSWVITAPEQITTKLIDQEQNQEIKRVMLERYGVGRYLQDSDAKLVHQDEYGRLFTKPIEGTDLVLTMVGVKNSTPEPDGSIKDYFLEVHPELRPMREDGGLGEPQEMTAKNAVASTFGLRGEDFHPLIET